MLILIKRMYLKIFYFIAAALLFLIVGCTDSTSVWVQGEGFRYRELDVKGRRAGFTEVAAQQSGMIAENQVSLDVVVGNRHMMHGSGVAIGDVTGDGLPDVYVARLTAPDVLYRNLGDWQFEDISSWSGLDQTGETVAGVVMVDIDGDHDLDLLLTMFFGPGAVYLNTGEGKFIRDANGAGLHSSYASTTATLADVDQDGDLDAYIARYKRIALADSLPRNAITWEAVLQDNGLEPREEFRNHYRFAQIGERVIRSELAEPDGLYLNDGSGQFYEMPWTGGSFLDTEGVPLTSIPRDWALTAKFYDVTGDDVIDLYVCNDFDSPDELWIGLGDGRFRRAPAHALRKTSNATMSVDFSDVNKDGITDFFATDMLSRDYSLQLRQRNTRIPVEPLPGDETFRPQEMQNTLMIGRGDTTFAELAWFAEIAASDWSWSTSFIDVDLDGWEDILITTGHVFDVQDLDAQMTEQRLMSSVSSWKEARGLILDFPPLPLKNVAFRNRRDLTFEDMPGGWGFGEEEDIAHGMAMGDLDGDGDLDVVTNRFNAPPGVYRNTGGADRLAVILEGKPPNTSGVGATITVECADLPQQTKQMSAGGSYLSSNQYMAVFAIKDQPCQVEVTWPLGQRSSIRVDKGNRLYVIEESSELEAPEIQIRTQMYELHQEFSPLMEREYNDFALQPLLPWHLSRRGPALAAVDIDRDGRFELLQGAGRGHMLWLDGRPILDSLHGDAAGLLAYPMDNGLTRLIVGESNDEHFQDSSRIHIYDINEDAEPIRYQKLSFGWVAPGPLSMADVDQDGDLDLFAGGHFIPGHYPISTNSRIYLNREGTMGLSTEFSAPFQDLGLVNGSVFGDLDGDGFSDLVLATEWGAVRIFKGGPDGFTDHTESLGVDSYKGWWRGVALGDFDGDGALDIAASNAGWNHRYGRSTPVRLYFGDFNFNGRTNVLESFFDPKMDIYRPSRMLSDLMAVISPIQLRIDSHRQFSTMAAHELLPIQRGSGQFLETNTYASGIFLNRGDHFEFQSLPAEAQYSAGISPVVLDANLDGHEDIVLSQNWFAYPLSTPRQDAGRGLLLLGHGGGTFSYTARSGFAVYGEGRAVSVGDFDGDQQEEIAFAQHNGPTRVYRKTSREKNVLVQFDSFSDAIGSVLRVVYSDESRGPARIVTAGAGYWSQNAPIAILGVRDSSATAVEVTWPNQELITVSLNGKDEVFVFRK